MSDRGALPTIVLRCLILVSPTLDRVTAPIQRVLNSGMLKRLGQTAGGPYLSAGDSCRRCATEGFTEGECFDVRNEA